MCGCSWGDGAEAVAHSCLEVRQHDGHSDLQPMPYGKSGLPPWVGGATEAGIPGHGPDGIRCPDPSLSATGTVRDTRRQERSVAFVDRCLGPRLEGWSFTGPDQQWCPTVLRMGWRGQRLQGCRLSPSNWAPTNGMHLIGLAGDGKGMRELSIGMSKMLDRQSERHLYMQRRTA